MKWQNVNLEIRFVSTEIFQRNANVEKRFLSTNIFSYKKRFFSTDLISTGDLPTGHRFDDIGHNGDGDEEAGDVVEYKGRGGCVWVFKSAPHPLAQSLQDDVTWERQMRIIFGSKKGNLGGKRDKKDEFERGHHSVPRHRPYRP